MDNYIETILMNLPSAVLVTDGSERIVFANTAFGFLAGERSQDFVGTLLKDSISHLDGHWEYIADEFGKPVHAAAGKGKPESRKGTPSSQNHRDPLLARTTGISDFMFPSIISLNGKIFTYRIFEAGQDRQGEPLKGLILNDFTEEKAFLDRMTQAENLSSLKTLAAGVSHEISNPLHTILTFSEAIVEADKDTDKIRKYAEKVVNNSKRLGKVLSDFSGYVQNREHGEKQEVRLRESIQAALKFALLPHPEGKFQVEECFHYDGTLMADSEDLQQIFFNIITNALQAMKGNGRLKISIQKNQSTLAIGFEDTGPGMPQDILRKAFNPFFTTKMQGEGTGLGLNITQRLVEKYHGKIEIESQEGKGTKVSIQFPTPSFSSKNEVRFIKPEV